MCLENDVEKARNVKLLLHIYADNTLLFNFVADCLTRMVIKAQSNDRITGLISNLIPKGLQFCNMSITPSCVWRMMWRRQEM
jgi:hypothetical protein